jgi:large conductance mechanosensitive channel
MFNEFKEFILKGNVIELGIAFIMGLAFNNIVLSLVNDIINPLISLIFNIPDLSYLKVSNILIGKFINSLIYFITISIVLFLFIVIPYNRLKKRLNKKEESNKE